MKEGKPKNNPLGFIERLRQKRNAQMREDVQITNDSDLLYPEDKIEITAQEAYELARTILHDADSAVEEERIQKGQMIFGLDRKKINSYQKQAQLKTIKSFLEIFQIHRRSPHHFEREYITAFAQAFVDKVDSE